MPRTSDPGAISAPPASRRTSPGGGWPSARLPSAAVRLRVSLWKASCRHASARVAAALVRPLGCLRPRGRHGRHFRSCAVVDPPARHLDARHDSVADRAIRSDLHGTAAGDGVADGPSGRRQLREALRGVEGYRARHASAGLRCRRPDLAGIHVGQHGRDPGRGRGCGPHADPRHHHTAHLGVRRPCRTASTAARRTSPTSPTSRPRSRRTTTASRPGRRPSTSSRSGTSRTSAST